MTTRIALLILGLLVTACERKSSTHLAAERASSTAQLDPPPVRPLMWSIERDGQTSYLLGTMHRGVDANRLPQHVWETLDAAGVLAVEADLSLAAKMPVLRTDGTSLRDELGPAYWTKLEDAVGVAEASRVMPFKPLIAATLVAMRGLPATSSIDGVVAARARERGKPIVFLETLDHQVAVIGKWFDARALRDMLDDVDAIDQTSKQMLAAYVAGDAAQIVAITARERARWLARGRSQAEYDEQMEDILYRRNASWIEPIERLHRDGGGFIAVGAAHLVGPRSVLELLAQRGYKVTPITR